MSNMLESMEITGGKARARRNYLPGFQGICMPCWLFCKPAVSCMFCLEAADCWLRSSVNSLAEASGEKDKAREKTHARAVFMLLFTIIARGCHWLMTASTLRISSSCPGQRNPTKSRIRQWIVPGAASFPFPQSPQMHEYEYFTKCMYVKVQSSACKAHPLLLSDGRNRKGFCKWYTWWFWVYTGKFLQTQSSYTPDKYGAIVEITSLHFQSRFC